MVSKCLLGSIKRTCNLRLGSPKVEGNVKLRVGYTSTERRNKILQTIKKPLEPLVCDE